MQIKTWDTCVVSYYVEALENDVAMITKPYVSLSMFGFVPMLNLSYIRREHLIGGGIALIDCRESLNIE